MIQFEYLEIEDIVEIIRTLGVGPIRDIGLLDSAVNRPRSSAFGEDAYETLGLKAAALLHSMTKNHALVDGNKRLAWLSTVVFCDLNGFSPDLKDDDAYQLVWDIASSAEVEIMAIADRLHLSPITN
ncbi:MAG: alcohol dehydrogenase [Acidimicrobiaceae bacterium]|nr:alcohol dehydrogenase [Acidimicrobiaceae bacterium]